MDLDRISTELACLFSAPRWIVLADVVAGSTVTIGRLRDWGGEEFLVIGSAEGVGDLPDAEIVLVPSDPATVMETFRRFAGLLADPPSEVIAAVHRFDAGGIARVLGPLFAAPDSFMGRRLYGSRPPAWEALEDKTLADRIWDQAGIPRADSVVVAVADAADAAARLAGSEGTVWAADNSEGWHGGGEYTRWIPDAEAASEATAWFSERAASVRVMPFLDGVPCSIHGVVTDDGVAALWPVELLILKRTDRRGFVYAGVATTWDAPDALAEEMREGVRAVGEVLRRRADYRGPFGIDGVATSDGFRPTELNPRFSVGFGAQAVVVRGLDHTFLVRGIVEGDVTVGAAELEATILGARPDARRCHVGFALRETFASAVAEVDSDDGGGTLTLGTSPSGAFLRWDVDLDHVPVGPLFAPRVARIAEVARDTWGLPIPDVVAASPVV